VMIIKKVPCVLDDRHKGAVYLGSLPESSLLPGCESLPGGSLPVRRKPALSAANAGCIASPLVGLLPMCRRIDAG
jgi:hypothetical protein